MIRAWRPTHMHKASGVYIRVTGIAGEMVSYDGIAGQQREIALPKLMMYFVELDKLKAFAELTAMIRRRTAKEYEPEFDMHPAEQKDWRPRQRRGMKAR